jgi:endonuclease-3
VFGKRPAIDVVAEEHDEIVFAWIELFDELFQLHRAAVNIADGDNAAIHFLFGILAHLKSLRQTWISMKHKKAKSSRELRAELVARELAKLYPRPAIPLDHKDAYTLLIAVVLSAQCTDKRVNQITPTLFAQADTPAKMIKISVEAIEDIVRPCGLGPQKAKAIWGLSKTLVAEHNGKVPPDFETLIHLPGVGRKTAQVVLAQAFNIPSFPVDTHIHRLATRWKLTNGKSVLQTEKDLKALFPRENWNPLHLRIIYYGREYCTARGCGGPGTKNNCRICRMIDEQNKHTKSK